MKSADDIFLTEMPTWITSMYSGNGRSFTEESYPIFLDATELGLTPCLECPYQHSEEIEMLEYDELAKKQMQIFFLHRNTAERDNDYPHK